MNPRTTGLLALTALLLGAFVYFYEIEGESGREAAREAEKRLFARVAAEDVTALELTTSDGVAARFERRDGAWRVSSPVEGAGDAMALDAIASAASQLARAGTVKAAPGDLAQFGLGPEARSVRFDADGERHVLRIGQATPVGGNVYVAAGDGGEVAYVERYRLNAFDRSLTDLRDRRVLDLDPAALQSLVVSWPEGDGSFEVELARSEQDVWALRKPAAGRADQPTVRELLTNLEYLQATGFVDERTPAVEQALAETAIAFAWSGEEQGAAGALRIAGLLDGERVVEREGRLYRIPPERLEDFARSLSAYRDKQLALLEPASLSKIELEYPGSAPIVLEHGDAGWSAGERAVDAEAAAGLAERLASLRAADIVADEMGEAERASVGLAPPAVRIRLSGRSDGQAEDGSTVVLELGRLDPERGLFARRMDQAAVFVLEASVAEALPLTPERFDERYGKAAAAAAEMPAAAPDFAPAADPSALPPASDLLEE